MERVLALSSMASILVLAVLYPGCARGNLECSPSGIISSSLITASPSDSVHVLVTKSADEARTTSLCHVFCLNYALENTSTAINEAFSDGDASWSHCNSTTDSYAVPIKVCVHTCMQQLFRLLCSGLIYKL